VFGQSIAIGNEAVENIRKRGNGWAKRFARGAGSERRLKSAGKLELTLPNSG